MSVYGNVRNMHTEVPKGMRLRCNCGSETIIEEEGYKAIYRCKVCGFLGNVYDFKLV